MPRLKQEETNVTPASEELDTYVGSGRHYQFNAIFTGDTTTSGNSVSLDSLGRVLVERNGQQIINVPAKTLVQMVDEQKGTVEVTNPAGGATRIVVPIPMWYPERDPNVVRTRSDEEVRVEIQPDQAQLSTDFDNGGNLKLFSVRAPNTQEKYTPRILNSRLSFNGPGETDNEELNVAGLTRLFFRETSADVIADGGLQVEWDGSVAVDRVTPEVLNDVANQLNRVESSPDALLEFNPMSGPGAQGASDTGAKISITSGASGDVIITRCIQTQMRA